MDIHKYYGEFLRRFGDSSSAKLIEVRAPGRVNLIGEHTDYNDGFVLPMALDRATVILCRRRDDRTIRLYSAALNEMVEFSVDQPVRKDPPSWSLYVRGVAEALRDRNLITHGIDALTATDVPLGGGLSSSASFEVACALALLCANARRMDPVEMALACQWAEHQYVGISCGIMDQFICALAQAGHAMLLDCRNLTYRQAPLDDPDLRVVIVNSNVQHELVHSEYQTRRNQCQAAAAHVRKKFPAVKALRDVTADMLEQTRPGMDPTVFRRARHVISENRRTLEFAECMARQDWPTCGRLLCQSHYSLRDDYEVSCPELDALVEIACSVAGVYGARLTGGGFGGCIVIMVPRRVVDGLSAALASEYSRRTRKQASFFIAGAGAGARVVRG
jgi:galactokinase